MNGTMSPKIGIESQPKTLENNANNPNIPTNISVSATLPIDGCPEPTVTSGSIVFDRVIATPDLMGVVGKLVKVLGPRGLMPNPKLGTVTMDVSQAVKSAKSGEVQFRVEKSGIVHAGIGKSSFDEKSIIENVKAFIKAVSVAKPSGSKGVYMKKITLSSSMGPGVKIDTMGVV